MASFSKSIVCVFMLSLGAFCTLPRQALASQALDSVRGDLRAGRVDDALQKLAPSGDEVAEAQLLRCQAYYEEHAWDAAIAACQRTVQLVPNDSDAHLWLGRAYGEKAERAPLLAAFRLARQVRSEFQMAVTLNPRNAAALSDLGEYDVEAPAIVGGGISKAVAVAAQLDSVSPARAHALRASIAEAQKSYAQAETEWKLATRSGGYTAQAWMNLAAFYQRRGDQAAMLDAIRNGVTADPSHGPALVDGASILSKAGVEPQLAIEMLRNYLRSDAQSEEAPVFEVRVRLARLLAQQGQQREAQEEIAKARALASAFPARMNGK